ncbi:hypothetical protein IMY05_003G0071200 [Salix suchowensis]|nr:hypothetical protein IMY05_003G0071200 [Salix suchowensis]
MELCKTVVSAGWTALKFCHRLASSAYSFMSGNLSLSLWLLYGLINHITTCYRQSIPELVLSDEL